MNLQKRWLIIKMVKKFYKHKLLRDENFPVRSYFPTLNQRYDLKHIVEDFDRAGLSDPKVYKLAQKEDRLVVTYNIKDFEKLAAKNMETGVIGVSHNLSLEQLDKKLTSLLNKSTRKSLLGKLTTITGESEL